MEETELFIISRLKNGDDDAYKFLFEHHYAQLCLFAAGILKDDFMAETVVGDVIFHLWQTRAQLEVHTSLRSYLARAVRNKCIDLLKYRHTEVDICRLTAADGAAVPGVTTAESDTPQGRLIEKELEQEVMAAVDSLPEECRRVFMKSRFERKKYREIAHELGITMNTVKYHMKNALDVMEQKLGKYILPLALLLIRHIH